MNFSKKETLNKQNKIKSKSRKFASKAAVSIFRTFIVCVVVVVIVGTCAVAGLVKGLIDNAPSIDSIDVAPSGFATTIYDAKGKEIQKLVGSDANRIYVNLDNIPKVVQNAFISIEDERFWEHDGIDVKGIFRAVFTGISNGRLDQGASTLTQQLLKNQIFNGGNETTLVAKMERKIQEQYLAVQLENKLSKKQILEYYLNTINLGQNTLGVQAASNRYFNKSVSDLTLSEAAVIAGITQNPTELNPISHPEENAKKRLIILGYMKDQGYINDKEYHDAVQDDVYNRIKLVNDKKVSTASVNSYFVDETINQVIHDLQEKLGYTETQATNILYRGGLEIYTTQVTSMQKIVDSTLADESLYPSNSEWQLSYQLSVQSKDGKQYNYSEQSIKNYFINEEHNTRFSLYFKKQGQAKPYIDKFKKHLIKKTDKILGESVKYIIEPQVSFVLMNQYNGKVLAIAGGRGEKSGSRTLNRATDSPRQPGSTFKILSTYLPALDTSGMTLGTVMDDSVYYYPGTHIRVNNWNGENYKGLTTLRDAITNSMNIVTVKTFAQVTPKVGFDYLKKLGFTTLVENYTDKNGKVYSDIQLPTALGGLTRGVTNLELTAAFASIANKGVYTKPVFYTKIVDHNGKVLLENKPKTEQVMKESTAWLLTNAMEDVVRKGTGVKARFQTINMPIAGKTGTTSDENDLWFVGYTPYYTAGIWGGYDNNKQQTQTIYHKIIWRTIMERIHKQGKKITKQFEKPGSIVSVKICTKSGKLAVPGLCDHALGGSTVRVEYYAKGTEPTEACDVHVKYKICTLSGKLASEYCPPDLVKEVVYLVKKENGNTADTPYILPKKLENSICDIHTKLTVPVEPTATPFGPNIPPSPSASPTLPTPTGKNDTAPFGIP